MSRITNPKRRFSAACVAGVCACCSAMTTAPAMAAPAGATAPEREPSVTVTTAPPSADEHRPLHDEGFHPRHLVGIKGVQVDEFHDGHTQGGIGFGVFFEESLVEGWVELETSAVVEWIDGHVSAPFELLVKKPFRATDEITPFIGLGPSLTVFESYVEADTGHHQETTARFGLTFVAGTYVWASDHWGFDVEVDYNLMLTHGIGHELTVAVGPVYRF